MAIIRSNGRKRKSSKKSRKSTPAKRSSSSRSYRKLPVKAAGSYPTKVGPFKLTKVKIDGRTAYKITGFAKKAAKIVFREDKAADFMRRRKKEIDAGLFGGSSSTSKSSTKRKSKSRVKSRRKKARANPSVSKADQAFIDELLNNPSDDYDFELDEFDFDDDIY